MNLDADQFMQNLQQDSESRAAMLQKIYSAADSAKVFGQAVVSGDYTVIPAAEIAGGGGFGSGMGFGPAMDKKRRAKVTEESPGTETIPAPGPGGAGGGGGGGGGSMGRPVAAIVIGPEGVEIKPILDMSKIGLTALTAFGGVALLTVKLLKKRA